VVAFLLSLTAGRRAHPPVAGPSRTRVSVG